jgi:hypothetical protein
VKSTNRLNPCGGRKQFISRRGFISGLIFAQAGALLISSGCALRSRQDLSAYRVVRHESAYFVYPPGQRAGSTVPERAVVDVSEFGASAAVAACSAADSLVALERGDPHGPTVVRVRLEWESAGDAVPTAEENRAGQLRLAFEHFENEGCLRHGNGRLAASRAVEALPLPFAEVLPYRYGFFRGGSAIDLQPETRLKVQQAFFRPEAGSSPSIADYSGTTTSYYDVVSAAGGIVLELGSVESSVPPGSETGQARTPALGHSPRKARYFRLAFLGLIVEGDTERKSVLISANDFEELEAISEAALTNPKSPCAASTSRASGSCMEFSGAVSTVVELNVTVNGEPRFVAMGTALRALAPLSGDGIAPDMRSKIKLVRRYGARKSRVRLDWDDRGALELPLLAGDELSWR